MLILLPVAAAAQDLRARVRAELEARGLGGEALGIIANVLEHDERAPPRTPAIVSRVLRDPLAGLDAAAIFDAAVPGDMQALASLPAATGADFDTALDRYIGELAEAQAELMAAVAPFDEEAFLRSLAEGLSAEHVATLHQVVDLERLARARALFLAATTRFVADVRTSEMPPPQRFDSAIGAVVIGSRGADSHPADAALIIDPGGDDVYQRAPAKGGAISVIVDFAGNDRYSGSDVALHALSAIFDLGGSDAYSASGAGLAAALAGVSVLVDLSGDDQYESEVFGQAAAAFGWAALVDRGGDDRYRLKAFGQGYASTAGLALLWDTGGNDAYVTAGLPDPYNRGGGLSFAQGAAAGWRGDFGGGVGILRDDAGDDRYEGQLYVQGSSYYYSFGLLWDRAGHDQYSAVRYAQGTGVHQSAALLQDDAGDDRYALAVGVGQGMGLDLAVGALVDRGGDDSYRSLFLSQGTATANGFGLLADEAGADSFEMSADPRSWGHAQWLRGLPSLGVLFAERARSRFARSGVAVPPQTYDKHETEPRPDCRADEQAVRAIIADPARHLGDEKLGCALEVATPAEARTIWEAFDVALGLPGAPFLQPIALALKDHPAPAPLVEKVSAILKSHPRCAARALWASAWASADEARAALESSCWRLQAAALGRLKALGVPPPASGSRPAFLGLD